ncbi:MAG: integrase core domain-containing protein, partial [Myxococcota bacterium]
TKTRGGSMKIFCFQREIYRASKKEVCSPEVQERLDKLKLWVELQQGGKTSQEAAALVKCGRSTLYRWVSRLFLMGRSCLVQAKRVVKRPHAQRLRKDLRNTVFPVQLDTIELSKDTYGVRRIQFSAVDPVTRQGAMQVYPRASASNGADFLRHVKQTMPWLCGIQVDGGTEFMGDFEKACQQAQIPLYVLPPRSPKLNGHVECFNRTCRYEFYNQQESLQDLETLRRQLKQFETTYNTIRPHQDLEQKTPYETIQKMFPNKRAAVS